MKRLLIIIIMAAVFILLLSCDNAFHTLASKDTDNQYLVVIGGEGGFVVSFYRNDSASEADPETIIVWSPAKTTGRLPAEPERTDYTFLGWNTEEYGKGTRFTSDTIVSADIDVYAQWGLNTYTVTFNAGGSVGSVPHVH